MQRVYREKKKDGTFLEITYDTDSIKDNCASCGHKLKEEEAHKRIRRYEQRGNYCELCNAKSNKLSQHQIYNLI
jgi:CRISPR/Cas system-associated protein Cas10 (large subunit of type III CRISPR-Cas system)